MQDKLIIEARINEYTQRGDNPHIPYTPEEIANEAKACLDAGASIVHFHARESDGTPTMAAEVYLDIVERIRQLCDVLVMPTLGAGMPGTSVDERMGHIRALAQHDSATPEFAPLDMASTNLDMYSKEEKHFTLDNMTYENTASILSQMATELREHSVMPVPVLWNVSSARLLDAFIHSGVLATPVYTQLSFTEGGMLAGHPASIQGLQAFLDFLPSAKHCHWSALCFGGSLLPLVEPILQRGGHLAIGIGDYSYPELNYPSNPKLIEQVVERARALGREMASPQDVRKMLLS